MEENVIIALVMICTVLNVLLLYGLYEDFTKGAGWFRKHKRNNK